MSKPHLFNFTRIYMYVMGSYTWVNKVLLWIV